MNWFDDRRPRLAVALVVFGVVALYVLWEVLWTVFFALTFVYVLYPVRERMVDRGVPTRAAAASLTVVALTGVVALFAPVLLVLYQRRDAIVDFLRDFPVSFELSIAGFRYPLEVQSFVPVVRETLSAWAVAVARVAPILAMKVFLFVFIVYALLYRPGGVRSILFRIVGDGVQDELTAYHERIRETLYGLYVVQAATGALTFVVALPVFAVLGYDAYFSLAVVSGILQFVPIIGPSVVVGAVAVVEVGGGDVSQALLVLVLGLVLVGFLPDAVIRPRLAQYTAGMPASLYFVGFLGGVFTVGPVGIIAGPLVLALFAETLELLADGVHAEGTPALDGDVGPDDGAPGVDDSTAPPRSGDDSTDLPLNGEDASPDADGPETLAGDVDEAGVVERDDPGGDGRPDENAGGD